MRKLFLVLMALTLSVATLACAVAPATPAEQADRPSVRAHVKLPFEDMGVLDGAAYRIRVPPNWNGTLIVYAHGLTVSLNGKQYPVLSIPVPIVAPGVEGGKWSHNTEDDLYALGYGMAGSSYGSAGWAVKEGIETTFALTNYFKSKVGRPRYTILWGFSMGGLIALESVSKYPGVYDAAISESGSNTGYTVFDVFLNARVAYDAVFGWPVSWGSVENVRDGLDVDAVVLELQRDLPLSTPTAKSELFRLILGQDAATFYQGSWLYMWFATMVTGDIQQRAGGNPLQNLNASPVSLTPEQKQSVVDRGGISLEQIDAIVTQINATKIAADRSARDYLDQNAMPTGDLSCPVITLHCVADLTSAASVSGVYQQKVLAAGKGSLLMQAYTDSPVGHGVFSEAQYLQTIAAMQSWLETRTRPIPASAFTAPGFVSSRFYPQP